MLSEQLKLDVDVSTKGRFSDELAFSFQYYFSVHATVIHLMLHIKLPQDHKNAPLILSDP